MIKFTGGPSQQKTKKTGGPSPLQVALVAETFEKMFKMVWCGQVRYIAVIEDYFCCNLFEGIRQQRWLMTMRNLQMKMSTWMST